MGSWPCSWLRSGEGGDPHSGPVPLLPLSSRREAMGAGTGSQCGSKGVSACDKPVGLSRSEPPFQPTPCKRCVPAVGQVVGTHRERDREACPSGA